MEDGDMWSFKFQDMGIRGVGNFTFQIKVDIYQEWIGVEGRGRGRVGL